MSRILIVELDHLRVSAGLGDRCLLTVADCGRSCKHGAGCLAALGLDWNESGEHLGKSSISSKCHWHYQPYLTREAFSPWSL